MWKRELEEQKLKHLAEVEAVKQDFELVKLEAEKLVREEKEKCVEEIKQFKVPDHLGGSLSCYLLVFLFQLIIPDTGCRASWKKIC